MNFDYNTLRMFARSGDRLGNWKGKPVFTCSVDELGNKGSGAFYILYDDDNNLVSTDGRGDYYSYGHVSSSGNVEEYNTRRRYRLAADTYEPAARKTSYSAAPGTDGMQARNEVPMAAVESVHFTKVELPELKATEDGYDVDGFLQASRNWSIEDMLGIEGRAKG